MKEVKTAILLFLAFSLICGGIYPAVITGAASIVFPGQAAGSLIRDESGRIVGSRLIGQPFSGPEYFWPRPSATANFGYNGGASGGSNQGPTNPGYLTAVKERVKRMRTTGVSASIPADLVQASASGLDPHISPAAAKVQVGRVARARGMSEGEVGRLVDASTKDRQFGILGDRRVNVLELNLALDRRLQ